MLRMCIPNSKRYIWMSLLQTSIKVFQHINDYLNYIIDYWINIQSWSERYNERNKTMKIASEIKKMLYII